MKIRNIAIPALALLALAACSMDKQRIDYKTSAVQVSPLEIPPDLTSTTANEQYSIPGASGVLAASFSDYSKGVAGQTARDGEHSGILPALKNRHLDSSGMQHWIVVEDKAENVWPQVKAFWSAMGFKIVVENPQAGVMETDWLENHGNVPKSYVRRVLGNGKALDILTSEGIRDQYVIRIEHSKDALSTEIHITGQVMQESLGSNRNDIKWVPHAIDPEIELALLQMMMDSMGSETNPALPKVVAASAVVPVAEVAPVVNVQLKESATGKVIQINEPFDRSWRRVGQALDSAHIVTTDKDRSKGIYFVAALQDKGKKDSKKQQPDYLVTVRESQEVSEVTVADQNGKNDAETVRLMDALYRSLGNSAVAGIKPPAGDRSGPPSGDAVRPSR